MLEGFAGRRLTGAWAAPAPSPWISAAPAPVPRMLHHILLLLLMICFIAAQTRLTCASGIESRPDVAHTCSWAAPAGKLDHAPRFACYCFKFIYINMVVCGNSAKAILHARARWVPVWAGFAPHQTIPCAWLCLVVVKLA